MTASKFLKRLTTISIFDVSYLNYFTTNCICWLL